MWGGTGSKEISCCVSLGADNEGLNYGSEMRGERNGKIYEKSLRQNLLG